MSAIDTNSNYYKMGQNIQFYVSEKVDPISEKIITNDYYTFSADEGNNIDEINAALFEPNENNGTKTATIMNLYTSDYEWFSPIVEDNDGNIILGNFTGEFEIDTDNKIARIENVPAGNYMILFEKGNTESDEQGEYTLHYNDGDIISVPYTIDNEMLDSKYFHPDYISWAVFSWVETESKYANFFFDKDVEYFEIKYVPGLKDDNNDVAEHYELDIKYKEYASLDYVNTLIGSAADLAETIVGESDSNNE